MLSHTSWPHRRASPSSPTPSRCFFGGSAQSEGESGIAVATVSGSLASLELAVRGYEAGHGTTAGGGAGYSAATTDPLASHTSDDDDEEDAVAADKHRLLNDVRNIIYTGCSGDHVTNF
nr:unnamed protein product [Callosobruchus chinensis]